MAAQHEGLQTLLRHQDRELVRLDDRWRVPLAGQCIGLRGIEAQAEIERSFRSR